MASKQKWEVGQIVKVGFVAGLEVIGKVATPGDYMPDLYVLVQASIELINDAVAERKRELAAEQSVAA